MGKQMRQYTLEYYDAIVRTPMLKFKKHILSEVVKRQEQDEAFVALKAEIAKKEAELRRQFERYAESEDEEEIETSENSERQKALRQDVRQR